MKVLFCVALTFSIAHDASAARSKKKGVDFALECFDALEKSVYDFQVVGQSEAKIENGRNKIAKAEEKSRGSKRIEYSNISKIKDKVHKKFVAKMWKQADAEVHRDSIGDGEEYAIGDEEVSAVVFVDKKGNITGGEIEISQLCGMEHNEDFYMNSTSTFDENGDGINFGDMDGNP